MNHANFRSQYAAKTTDEARLLLMKNYMLNLSSTELDSFIFGNLRDIRHYLETTDISDAESDFIFAELDAAKALIQKPIKQVT